MSGKNPERRGLGRGLSALMADASLGQRDDDADRARTRGVRVLPIEVLRPNPDQPRRAFSRAELEGLAAALAAQHATPEEVRVLQAMVQSDSALVDDPAALSRANRRFHKQIHLASHNRYLISQLDLVHRSMALLATTSLAADGRGVMALTEHKAIVAAIANKDCDVAADALKRHLSFAFETRLKLDSGEVRPRKK